MSYNSYGKNDYYSGGRGGYNDSYHGGSRRGSPRGGGRSYSSRGGNSYYQGGGSGGSSSRYQGNSNYGGGGNYNQSSSRNDDSYRTVRYSDSPKTTYRSAPSYDSGSKRPRLDNDSRYGNSGGSSYKGSSYRHQDSYNGNYSSSLKREYEKAKARDYMFNSNKGSMAPPPTHRYTRGNDRPFRARGRGRSSGGYMTRKPYGTTPVYMKSKLMDPRFRRNPNPMVRNSYQVEKLRKLKRIQQIRARRRLAEGETDWKEKDEDDDKDEMEGSSEEVEEEEEEVEEELEEDAEEDEEENGEEGKEEEGDKAEGKEDESTSAENKEGKPAAPKKKKVTKKVVKVVKKLVKRKKELGSKAKVSNGDNSTKNTDDRVMFKLDCPACKLSCLTYREYTLHLYTSRHMDAMKKLVGTLRAELNAMRNDQREEQKTFEEENKGEGLSTLYCEMCKLNYRQLKSEHMRSERHKKMREFLIPICKVCHMTCKSQMAYQNHICSISHLKAAQRLTIAEERRAKYRSLRETEGKDVNMDNFMVLDSVGSADEEEDEIEADAETGDDAEKKRKKKEVINVGSEYVKKVTAFYCELCHFYLNRTEENEADVLARHCQNRAHMKRYVSARDDLALRKKAEKLHRELEKLNEEEEKEKAAAKKKDGGDTGGKKEAEESSDEENEEGGVGRRYDRFQAGNATSVKKLDIDIDLDEDVKDVEMDKKEEEEILGEDNGGVDDAKEGEKNE